MVPSLQKGPIEALDLPLAISVLGARAVPALIGRQGRSRARFAPLVNPQIRCPKIIAYSKMLSNFGTANGLRVLVRRLGSYIVSASS